MPAPRSSQSRPPLIHINISRFLVSSGTSDDGNLLYIYNQSDVCCLFSDNLYNKFHVQRMLYTVKTFTREIHVAKQTTFLFCFVVVVSLFCHVQDWSKIFV